MNFSLLQIFLVSKKSLASEARKPSLRSPTAQNPFRASKKSSVLATNTSPPQNSLCPPTARSTFLPVPPRPSSSPNAAMPNGSPPTFSPKPNTHQMLPASSLRLRERSRNKSPPKSPNNFARWLRIIPHTNQSLPREEFSSHHHSPPRANSSIASRPNTSASHPMQLRSFIKFARLAQFSSARGVRSRLVTTSPAATTFCPLRVGRAVVAVFPLPIL